ncbi:DedA family protein [Syntrophomonas palmitatica]|uniref:DedA family protein n=1 Tax=Syntrophomonas palmitatica TaxID=402877 RepID=UPI0006CF5751
MNFITLWDIFIHVDKYLTYLIQNYGIATYLIIFLIIFCETGLVVTPFLPGDSLIFVLGALAASGEINALAIGGVLMLASIIGNICNYEIGKFIGPRAFENENPRLFKKEYLVRTHEFFEKHGGKTIVIARFMPIIRTFAPFVAGIGQMNYKRFLFYNLVGCVAWVLTFMIGGYSFGNIPAVERNFTLVIFGIILISLLPAVIASIRQSKAS